VREAARVCGYCRSPIATIRCSRCFMMNVPDAHHCMCCGAELGLQPLSAVVSDAHCPRCAIHLDGFQNEDGTILDCGHCGGQFVTADVLQAMIRRHESAGMGTLRRYRAGNPLAEPLRYLRCPVCKDMMNRRNFGRLSGIVVDVCAKHGTWFDVGELPRILAFVGDGGLQRTAALMTDNAERRRSSAVEYGSAAAWPDFSDQRSAVSWQDMHEAALAFARWVRRQL